MKQFLRILICALAYVSLLHTQPNGTDNYKIVIEPLWQDLEHSQIKVCQFNSKWILTGSITFEKKAKEVVNLYRLYLRWNGISLENLIGSLYRKSPGKEFYPIEANLLCDGDWSKSKQTLMFTFDEEQTLGLRNIFYLVLTIPYDLEAMIRQGSFEILSYSLPEPFRPNRPEDRLSFSLDAVGSITVVQRTTHH